MDNPSPVECLVCRKHRSEVSVPGGVIYENELIYISHPQLWGDEADHYLGHLFVEPKRHAPELADLTDAIGLQFDVTDTNAATSSVTLFPLEPGLMYIPFADFIGTADFSDADIIKLTISGQPDFDLTINLLATASVPEPIGLAVWSVALSAGFLGLRRRRS